MLRCGRARKPISDQMSSRSIDKIFKSLYEEARVTRGQRLFAWAGDEIRGDRGNSGVPVALQATSKELLRPALSEGGAWRVAEKVWSRIEPLVRHSAAIVIFLLLWELAPRFGLTECFCPHSLRSSSTASNTQRLGSCSRRCWSASIGQVAASVLA